MNPLDESVITTVAHGATDDLIKAGLKLEFIQDPDAKAIFLASLDMMHRVPAIKPNRLNLLATTWNQLRSPERVKELVSLNGKGEIPPDVVATKCYDRHLSTETNRIKGKIEELQNRKPEEIKDWLPNLSAELESLIATGKAYNPLPSAHTGKIVAPVMFKSRVSAFNEMFKGRMDDGGGYRAGWWVVWVAPTGRGKSSGAFTMAMDAILNDKRVVVVSKEKQETVKARVLLGLTGLTLAEIESGVCVAQEPMLDETNSEILTHDRDGNPIGAWHLQNVRQKVLDTHLAGLEKYLRLYDWSFARSASLKAIISSQHPSILEVDYFDANDVPGTDTARGLGKIAQGMEDLTHQSGIHTNGYFQIANAEVKSYEKNDRHEIPGPYGSGMVKHTADQYIQTKWWRRTDTQHFLRTKCRAGGLVESYYATYNPRTMVFSNPSGPCYPA